MNHNFAYLIDNVLTAGFLDQPFRHIFIEDFFTAEHFQEIIDSPQVALAQARNDRELLQSLHEFGYEEIVFPGTTTNLKQYIAWHKTRDRKAHTNVEICEGFGVTMRLKHYQEGSIIEQINAFFNSPSFISTLHKKFALDGTATYPDNGLQKYLDGYEISPHPDVRTKALTYMINVNPAKLSEEFEFHTHYLRFIQEREYVGEYWRGNPSHERCWVPWHWCESKEIQRKNNSIVIFSPADDTLHAIRANYDHLKTQRTQFYGNFWYHNSETTGKPTWRDFQIGITPEIPAYVPGTQRLMQKVKCILPASVVNVVRRAFAAR